MQLVKFKIMMGTNVRSLSRCKAVQFYEVYRAVDYITLSDDTELNVTEFSFPVQNFWAPEFKALQQCKHVRHVFAFQYTRNCFQGEYGIFSV